MKSIIGIDKAIYDVQKTITELRTTKQKVLDIANASKNLAVSILDDGATLSNATYNQKHNDGSHADIQNSIQVVNNDNEYVVMVNTADGEVYWNAYFSEHGAGLGSDGKHGGYVSSQSENGWNYTDLNGVSHHVTSSKALHYMRKSYKLAKNNVTKLAVCQRQHKKFVPDTK